MPRPPAAPPEVKAERKRAQTGKVLKGKSLEEQLRLAVQVSFNVVGGAKYLAWLAKNKPTVYGQILTKYMGKDEQLEQSITFVVQQFAVQAGPVPGVTNSPIIEHIAGPRLSDSSGEVVDVEPVAHD